MTRRIVTVLLTLLFFAATTTSVGLARTWTDLAGRQFDGDFVAFDNGIVKVKRTSDMQLFDIPLETLSDGDQDFICTQVKPVTLPEAARYQQIIGTGLMKTNERMTAFEMPVVDKVALTLAFRSDAITNPVSQYAVARSVERIRACEAAIQWGFSFGGKGEAAAKAAYVDAVKANTRDAYSLVSAAASVALEQNMQMNGRPLVASGEMELIQKPGALGTNIGRETVLKVAARVRAATATVRTYSEGNETDSDKKVKAIARWDWAVQNDTLQAYEDIIMLNAQRAVLGMWVDGTTKAPVVDEDVVRQGLQSTAGLNHAALLLNQRRLEGAK